MKTTFLTIALFTVSILAFSQEEKTLGVLESDTTWLKEIIKFPINFAPEINYEGFEELRFAKKWRDPSNEDFWCYSFAWYIENNETQSVNRLEKHIKLYYDGLMTAVNKKKDFEVPETTVLFIKTPNHIEGIDFIGKIYVYDAFTSEDMITLNVKVKEEYCTSKKSSVIIFQLSPQNFNHDIWNRFDEIRVKSDYCY